VKAYIKLDISLHGVPVVMPTNDREISGSTPGRYNLQIKITSVSEDHASCWVHKDLTAITQQIQALLTAARASGRKDECQVRLTGIELEYCMGTEISRLGGYGFQGTVTAGDDGSNQKGGKMGAGYVNMQKQRKRQQRKVGREEGGSSSNRPELAAFILAFRGTPVTNPMLFLCDNQALLKA